MTINFSLKQKNIHLFKLEKQELKTLLYIFILNIFCLTSIFRANYNYFDDNGRTLWGYTDFGFGRFISDNLSQIICANNFLGDISPLSQIISQYHRYYY